MKILAICLLILSCVLLVYGAYLLYIGNWCFGIFIFGLNAFNIFINIRNIQNS